MITHNTRDVLLAAKKNGDKVHSPGGCNSISGYLTENTGTLVNAFILREWPLWEPYILNNPTAVKSLLDWLVFCFFRIAQLRKRRFKLSMQWIPKLPPQLFRPLC